MTFNKGDLVKYRNHFIFGNVVEDLKNGYLLIDTYSKYGQCIDKAEDVELICENRNRKDDKAANIIPFGGIE